MALTMSLKIRGNINFCGRLLINNDFTKKQSRNQTRSDCRIFKVGLVIENGTRDQTGLSFQNNV